MMCGKGSLRQDWRWDEEEGVITCRDLRYPPGIFPPAKCIFLRKLLLQE